MISRPKIKLRLTDPKRLGAQTLAYQIVARALSELNGEDQHVERGDLVEGVREELKRIGYTMKNIDATVSSFCALDGVEAIVEYPGGHIEPFESRRTVRKEKSAVVTDRPSDDDYEDVI